MECRRRCCTVPQRYLPPTLGSRLEEYSSVLFAQVWSALIWAASRRPSQLKKEQATLLRSRYIQLLQAHSDAFASRTMMRSTIELGRRSTASGRTTMTTPHMDTTRSSLPKLPLGQAPSVCVLANSVAATQSCRKCLITRRPGGRRPAARRRQPTAPNTARQRRAGWDSFLVSNCSLQLSSPNGSVLR